MPQALHSLEHNVAIGLGGWVVRGMGGSVRPMQHSRQGGWQTGAAQPAAVHVQGAWQLSRPCTLRHPEQPLSFRLSAFPPPSPPHQQQDVVKQLHNLGGRLQQRDDLGAGGGATGWVC